MTGRSMKNGGLFPSVFNVATKADIYVNATCGDDGPETFCKPSEFTRCAVCDPNSPDPGKRHNASYALDSNPARWWQSPTLARGERFEYVTITLDLKQVREKKIINIHYQLIISSNFTTDKVYDDYNLRASTMVSWLKSPDIKRETRVRFPFGARNFISSEISIIT